MTDRRTSCLDQEDWGLDEGLTLTKVKFALTKDILTIKKGSL